jgi:UrcA family protein
MNITTCRLLSALLITVAVCAAAPCASAADTNPGAALTPAVTVHFADLNPSTAAGVHALYDRIADAAQTVCGPSFSLWDANAHRTWKVCYRATIDHTVRQINRPELTALHQKMMGSPAPGQVAASAVAAVRIR